MSAAGRRAGSPQRDAARRSAPEILWRLLRYGLPYRRPLLAAFGCMALLGATTGAFAYLMGPALRFLLRGGEADERLAATLRWLGPLDRERVLWLFPAVILALGVLKGLAYLGQFYWMGLYGQRVVADLRRDVFAKLASLSPQQASAQLSGDLLSRFSAGVSAVEAAATTALGAYVRDGLQILILAAVALAVNWRIALGTLLLVPLAALPVAHLTRSLLRRTSEGQVRLGQLAGQVQEGLGGLKTIQAFNGQAAERLRFGAHAARHLRSMTRAGWVRGAVPALMEILGAGAVAGALALALSTSAIPPDQLVSVLAALVLLYQPAKDLGRVGQFVVQAAAAGERLFELLDVPHPVRDAPGAPPAPPLRSSVRLEGVSFSYGDRSALDGLTLELPVGQVTALVGPSGAGKSTVTRMLLRFERPHRGAILLDGVDADRFTADSVRAQFALVTQEPLLFAGSVADNVRFSRPAATQEEVVRAAKLANADAFIRALPQGYDTPVGERGVVLSGGQRQRICLARALLAEAPMLVLDEATSSLDPESEREVQEALGSALVGKSALVIAHRLSTVVGAHRICVVDDGRVVEEGTHAELLAAGRLYARLWALQKEPLARANVA